MEFLIPKLKDIIDILIIAFIFYRFILFVKKTGGYSVLIGLVSVVILYFLSILLKLQMLAYLLRMVKDFWVIALIILFQPEIRIILSKVGHGHVLFPFMKEPEKKAYYHAVLGAVSAMSFRKTGALIVFEKKTKLDEYISTGEIIDAKISTKLLLTIFNNKTILHDGAIVIRGDRIIAVKVVLPLTQNVEHVQEFGTRHLAAIGISDKSDAYAIVVSEETGKISFAEDGEILKDISVEELSQRLSDASK